MAKHYLTDSVAGNFQLKRFFTGISMFTPYIPRISHVLFSTLPQGETNYQSCSTLHISPSPNFVSPKLHPRCPHFSS